jgi:hypothetical protein
MCLDTSTDQHGQQLPDGIAEADPWGIVPTSGTEPEPGPLLPPAAVAPFAGVECRPGRNPIRPLHTQQLSQIRSRLWHLQHDPDRVVRDSLSPSKTSGTGESQNYRQPRTHEYIFRGPRPRSESLTPEVGGSSPGPAAWGCSSWKSPTRDGEYLIEAISTCEELQEVECATTNADNFATNGTLTVIVHIHLVGGPGISNSLHPLPLRLAKR